MKLPELDVIIYRNKVMNSNNPVVAVFYANWLGSWQIILSILNKIHLKYQGQISFYKINIQEEESLAIMLGVKRVPTILFIKNGSVQSNFYGMISKLELENRIKELLTN